MLSISRPFLSWAARMPRLRVLMCHRVGLLGQPIEAPAHVRRPRAPPDPRRRGPIQLRQRGQRDHTPDSPVEASTEPVSKT